MQRPQTNLQNTALQRQMQQYMGRPPPEYQPSMEPASAVSSASTLPTGLVQSQLSQAQINTADSRALLTGGHRVRTNDARKLAVAQAYPGTIPIVRQTEQTLPDSSTHSMMIPTAAVPATYSTGRGRGKQANSRTGAASNRAGNSGVPRHQRPPNVNVGPEGLNISQRPPGMTSDWRQIFMQQQQQQQSQQHVTTQQSIRMPFARNHPGNYALSGGFVGLRMENSASNNSGANNSGGELPAELMQNQIRPVNDQNIGMQPALQNNSGTTTNHTLLQQQRVVMQGSGLGNSANSLLSASQIQIASSGGMSMTSRNSPLTPTQVTQPMYNPSPQQPSQEEASQNTVSDTSQFTLDFLDNIDCSASDLLNFDVMQGGTSDFALLDEMGVLGK